MRRMLPGLLALTVVAVFAAWAYPHLPERIATHWDLHGQPDGWSSRLVGITFGLGLGAGLLVLFSVLPKIDPLKRNYALHGSTYWTVANGVLVLLAAIQGLVLVGGLGWRSDLGRFAGVGVGALFVLLGNLMPRMRPNWFMGIRTPWTLSSETVWRKTHRVGGRLFVVAGLMIALVGLLRTAWMPVCGVAVLAVAVIGPIVYSWMLWKKEQPGGRDSEEGSSL